jgi:hypothetical protein
MKKISVAPVDFSAGQQAHIEFTVADSSARPRPELHTRICPGFICTRTSLIRSSRFNSINVSVHQGNQRNPRSKRCIDLIIGQQEPVLLDHEMTAGIPDAFFSSDGSKFQGQSDKQQ